MKCNTVGETTQRWLVQLALFSGLLMSISRLNFPDPDMFHAMALARESLRIGHVPEVDLFAYTPTVSPSIHHEWGSGVALYFVTVVCGLGAGGLLALKFLVTGAVASGSYLCARREGGSVPVFAVLAPVAILLSWIGFTTLRAQVFTLLFLTCLMLFFSLDRRGRRWWVILWLPLFVVWLNVHGGVLAGVGLYGLHTMEQFVRRFAKSRSLRKTCLKNAHLLAGGLAMIPLSGVSPYGFDHVRCLLEAASLDRPLIREWGPLWMRSQPEWILPAFALSLAAVAYAARERGWKNLPGLPMVLVGALLALMHIRHGSIYALIWLCHVPGYLASTRLALGLEQYWNDRRGLIGTCAAASIVYCGSITAQYRPWELHFPTTRATGPLLYPSGAVDYLDRVGFQGHVMTPFRAGSYVSWRLYPRVKVSFDGRYEAAYPPEALAENFAFFDAAPGWRDTLDRYQTDVVLVPTAAPLGDLLKEEAGWTCVYTDDGYSVLARPDIADHLPVESRVGEPITMRFP